MKKQIPLLIKIANKRGNHIGVKEGALVSVWKYEANMTKYIQANTNG